MCLLYESSVGAWGFWCEDSWAAPRVLVGETPARLDATAATACWWSPATTVGISTPLVRESDAMYAV